MTGKMSFPQVLLPYPLQVVLATEDQVDMVCKGKAIEHISTYVSKMRGVKNV